MITAGEIRTLWDFQTPPLSEARFTAALVDADRDSQSILLTQIARTWGLRKDFERARQVLGDLGPLDDRPVAVKAWYWLEWGRTYASPAHPESELTESALAEARQAFGEAIRLADEAGLDELAVDGLHMMVCVDREPQQQLGWNYRTLERIQSSQDRSVDRWLGALHNNIGYALHLDGQYDRALAEFELSKQAYQAQGDLGSVGIENWMIAWTYRVMGRPQEALSLQLENERVNAGAGTPDFYVFDELETLYRALGDTAKADHYRNLKESHRP